MSNKLDGDYKNSCKILTIEENRLLVINPNKKWNNKKNKNKKLLNK